MCVWRGGGGGGGGRAAVLGHQGNRLALTKRLLEKFPAFKSTVNTPDLQGRTPLIWAGIKARDML